ncbi:hypothetical protein [Devosia sp. CN2-171]|uniref:hypothetical protein n=1 Tax=Devosia sp. CN2-171 TaxID=3400909 RepID=UPI003BF8CA40
MSDPRFPMRRYWWWLAVILVPFLVPLALSVGADWILQLNGCTFDLKGGTTCVIGRTELGPILGSTLLWSRAVAFTWMWFAFIALPIWLTVLLVHRRRWRNAA